MTDRQSRFAPGSLFSASWYRVSGLRPRLVPHARIHRHVYRGRPGYLLQDLASQKFQLLPPEAHTVLGLMDGQRTANEIWLRAAELLGDDAPTQDDLIRLLAQLHAADVLQTDVPPDAAELLERYRKRTRRERIGRYLNPFAIRIPLIDPERLLARGVRFVRPLVGRLGLLLWLAVVLPALVLVGLHWPELSEGVFDRVFEAQNLLLIWLCFPVIKTLHELGHGFAAKAFGCEVHDMGIMLLVFTPIPYVDASSTSALPEKGKRALVGAAGMLVEVFVAALAVYVWVSAEPGLVRTLAFDAMLIGGVATLGFNLNPLLRFDGYYILADLIEIPNLRQRASRFLAYLFERFALRRADAERPEATASEASWLVGYGVASFVYRVVVVVAIFLFILEKSLVVGTALVLLASIGWIALPMGRALRALFADPRLEGSRSRAVAVLGGGLAALVGLLGFVPFPYRTQVEGVVWIPEEALVRAGTDGFIERVLVEPGRRLRRGDPIASCRAPELDAEVRVLEARRRVLDARYHQERVTDLVRAAMIDEERGHVRERLARAREQVGELVIRARTDGVLVAPAVQDLPGRFVRQGQPIAHVLPGDGVTIRAVVSEDDIDLVRDPVTRARVRLAERRAEVVPAEVRRVVPAASAELPSSALGRLGGGRITVDPRDERGISAMEKLFVVDLALPGGPSDAGLGGRAHVRFEHSPRPLFSQWYRAMRQLFLERLDV